MPHRAHTLLEAGHGYSRARKLLHLSWWGSLPDTLRLHCPPQPDSLRNLIFSFRTSKCFQWVSKEGPCWPGAKGFSPCLRGIAWPGGGGGGGGGWGRVPTATRALSSSSGSRGDGEGVGSPSPDDHLTPTRSAGESSVNDRLAAARARREPAQATSVVDRVAGGAARGAPGGWKGYGASPRGGGSGGDGGRGGGGGGAGVNKRSARAKSVQLNCELSQAGSVEQILTLIDEHADVFNAVNVSTAFNKLW